MTVCAFITLGPAEYALGAERLELKLTFDKNEYKKTDPIKVNFTLINKGAKGVYVNNRFFLNTEDSPRQEREIYLIAVSPSGEKLPCKVEDALETGLPRTDNFVLLAPGEETSLNREKHIKHFFDFGTLGTYKITAVYQNVYGEEIGVGAYKGKLKSKPAEITIVE